MDTKVTSRAAFTRRPPPARARSTWAALFALLFAALAGCGGEDGFDLDGIADPEDDDIGSRALGIVGGQTTRARPEVARFDTRAGMCTATLISPRHFVTAAHCTDYAPISHGGTLSLQTPRGTIRRAVDRVFGQGRRVGAADIAVGRLVQTVSSSDARPASISTRQPAQGWRLTAMGYGCNSRTTRAGAGTKRYREYIYSGRTRHLCWGDSGGPVFLGGVNGSGGLIRINSGISAWRGNDIGADAVRHRGHILALTRAMETDGICYRAHVSDRGWMPAVCNGASGGTTGQSRSMQAIQIWSARPGVSVCYRAHVQNKGWMREVCDGEMAGTTGASLRLEALRVRLASTSSRGERLQYQAHVAKIGWQPRVWAGGTAGTTGRGLPIEAMRFWLR